MNVIARWTGALVGSGILISTIAPSVSALTYREVVVSNVDPRRDVDGKIVDAHDGALQFFRGRYYLYGTAYGTSAGFGINNRFRVYSSPDLQRWTFENELLKEPPNGVYYRPYVVYNARTRKYVLWYNWYPKLWEGQYGVATSDTPEGPFVIRNTRVRVSQAAWHPGDLNLFVDDDGVGYLIYTAIGQGHSVRVERLTADFLGTTRETSAVLGQGSEAVALFKRGGLDYALFDRTCCFCSAGSGAQVLVAAAPLGPYTERGNGNINRRDGAPIVAAQQTFVARLPAPQGNLFVWIADRWGSRPDGIKGHDFQFWSAPLQFEADGSIRPIENVPQWRAKILMGQERGKHSPPYVWPKKKDPTPLTKDPCTGEALAPDRD